MKPKILLAIVMCAGAAMQVTAQDLMTAPKEDNRVIAKPAEDEAAGDKVLTMVEQMPQFPGGAAAMYQFIGSNIVYPAEAAQQHIQGRVVVRFVVKKDGSIGRVTILRGVDPALDAEAMRVVSLFPKFTPGMNNGVPVNVWFTLPISFRLSAEQSPSE